MEDQRTEDGGRSATTVDEQSESPGPIGPSERESRFLDSVDSWTGETGTSRPDPRAFFEREALALADQRPERAALMWIELACVGHDQGADDAEVLGWVESALALRPHAGWLLMRARRLLLERGLYAQALPLAEREAQAGGEANGRAAVLYEASSINLYRLHDPNESLRLAEQALRVQPHHVAALVRVASLREQLDQHVDAARALQQLSEYLTDPSQRAQLLYATGTIHEMRLDHDEAAQAAYLGAIESDPSCVPALLAVCELQERTEQWSALARSVERLAELIQADSLRAKLWHQAGTLHLDRTGNLEAACRDLVAAATAAPQDVSVLQRLAHAWEARGRSEEAIRTLEQLLELTLDRQTRAALRTHIATLALEQLHDIDRATAAFRGALDEAPGYLPALQSLGTLYRQQAKFAELVEISNPETEGLLPAEARAVRYVELAQVLNERLDQPDAAIAAYRRAIDLSPGNMLAFWELAALLRRLGRQAELAELLALQAEASEDTRTRAHLLLRRAQIQALSLADPGAAIETLCRAKADDGARAVALERIDLHAQAKRHATLAELLLVQAAATEDPHEAEGRRLQAARVLELALGESEKALDLYRQVLADNPQCAAAIHGAGRILHRRGAWTELVELYYFELEHQPGRVDASTLLCRVGRILVEKLGQHAAAVEAYARAIELDAGCTPALAALEQLARSREQWTQLVSVLERRATERHDTSSATASLCRAAELAGWQLGQWADAARLYERALEQAPGLLGAQLGLLRVLGHEQRWADAIELLQQLAEAADTDEGRDFARLSRARLQEFRLGQPVQPAHYEGAVTEIVRERLQHQRTRARRLRATPDLADWLHAQGERTGDDALGAAYLLEAAQMWELGEEVALAPAHAASSAAHRRAPTDLNAIWTLERTLIATKRWSEVGALRERESQLELDRTVRAQHLSRAARAYCHAEDREVTARLCHESLNFDPDCLPALRLLAHVAEHERDWQKVGEIYDRIAAACNAADNRRAYALLAAEVWAGLVRDRERALASVAVALADDPSNEEAFSFAERLLRSENELEELSSSYGRAIQACEDSSRKVELLRRNARLLAQIGSRYGRSGADRAIAELSALLVLQPGDVDALAELAELQARQRRWSDAAGTLGRLIEHATDDQVRHMARVEQAELWLEKLHEPTRAGEVLELAARERPDDLGIARLRLRVMRAVADWSAARALLEKVAADAQRAVRIWTQLQLAEVARLGLKDPELQHRCENELVQLAATDAGVVEQLRDLRLERAQILRLVELAEQTLDDASEDDANGRRRFIAAIATEELGDPVRALPHLKKILELKPHDPGATLLMARALEAKDEPEAAVSRYRQVLESAAGSVEAYRGLARTGGPEIALSAAAIVDMVGTADSAELLRLEAVDWNALPDGSLSAEPPQPEQRFNALQQILEALLPYLNAAYPSLPGQPPEAHHPVTEPVRHLAHTLGLRSIEIKLGETGTARVGIGHPATLQIDGALAAQPHGAEFRFWVGRALARALVGGAILQQLDEAELEQLFTALHERKTAAATAPELQRTLHRAVPRKVRRHVTGLVPKARDPKIWRLYRRRLERWADRLALVLCRHPGVGLRALARSEGVDPINAADHAELAALMRFVVSDEYARLYRSVWRPSATASRRTVS